MSMNSYRLWEEGKIVWIYRYDRLNGWWPARVHDHTIDGVNVEILRSTSSSKTRLLSVSVEADLIVPLQY